MDKPTCKLVGAPCGQHGQYTFYKAIRLSGEQERIIAIGDFFFVKLWQDSELVSIGELQLLWTDRVADQTLVSLRLYFLPENTPEGRNGHGEDEVLAIGEKVVLRADDLLSWVCAGQEWRWGLRAVWRGACAPPADRSGDTHPLHKARLDFSDVDTEKGAIVIDESSPGVVVFSYPRYCRYRALLSRLEGAHAHWLRQSLVAALGGYAAPTANTRILYCRDTFDYPELEGHEFVCNHLAPKLKGRPRGRRRRRARSRSHSRTSRSSESDGKRSPSEVQPPPHPTPRRLSLRNGKTSDEEDDRRRAEEQALDKGFMRQLKAFYKTRGESFRMAHGLKELSLRALYEGVSRRGGYTTVTRRRAWRSVHSALRPRPADPSSTKTNYERFLLAYENHQRRTGTTIFNCSSKSSTQPAPSIVDTIDVTDSPLRETITKLPSPAKRLRTPSPQLKAEDLSETKKENKENPAETINREFLDSLPPKEEIKLTLKPVELLLDTKKEAKIDTKYLTFPEDLRNNEMIKSFAEDNSALIAEIADKYNLKDSSKILDEIASKQGLSDGSTKFLAELAQKLNLGHPDSTFVGDLSLRSQASGATLNGHPTDSDQSSDQKGAARPAGRSSLRSVRVKPARSLQPASTTTNTTPPMPPLRPDSASSSPPVTSSTCNPTNFGINYPPSTSTSTSTSTSSNQVTSTNNQDAASDDEIVEVPYKPKTPEIIDLDEYPESPQSVKKKKLDILKERGLEVTAIPNTWTSPVPVVHPSPMLLNPAVQHQIMTQAQLFQMYNILPSYSNGVQPPKVIQGKSIFGTSGPEKTVYGNPKDPFMPPPHILQGTPIKPTRNIPTATQPTPQDILDLTCKTSTAVSPQKPAVEIVKVPRVPSPSKPTPAQNLTKNYTLVDGKAVVGSNLEITLVSPKHQTPVKNRPPQKRSSNGKFVSTKTPTPPKEVHSKPYKTPSPSTVPKDNKPNIIVPNYQINSTRDEPSPTGSTGSSTSQSSTLMQNNFLQTVYKGQNNLAQLIEMQKAGVPSLPFIDPMYMSALYSSLAGQMDQRQLAMYRDLMASQFRSYPALLNMGAVSNTPTTKN